MTSEADGVRPAWHHARALFVLFHVGAVLVLSLPAHPGISSRASWKSQNAQADFAAWAATLQGLGLEVDAAGLEATLWDLSRGYLTVRNTAATPFAPYARATGATQGWQMMTSPQRRPVRLRVEVRPDGGPWRAVYETRSDTLDWNRAALDYHRLRKVVGRFARTTSTATYDQLARWLATQAAVAFPDATTARVSQLRSRVLPAEEVRTGATSTEKVRRVRRFDLEALR